MQLLFLCKPLGFTYLEASLTEDVQDKFSSASRLAHLSGTVASSYSHTSVSFNPRSHDDMMHINARTALNALSMKTQFMGLSEGLPSQEVEFLRFLRQSALRY